MNFHVLIGFLFTCFIIEESKARNSTEFELTTMDVELFDNGLWVYDDMGNLVQVTAEMYAEEDEEGESLEETSKDLEKRVNFMLYSSDNSENYQPLFINDQVTLMKSNFDNQKATRIITHGWMNSFKSPACTLIRDAYLKHGDYNVIVVDWSRITFRPYTWASNRVQQVGKYVASMINFLVKHGLDLSETTLVGHSLGAHVMGIAGHNSKNPINYIVGLDPALPGFTFAGKGSRIFVGDAKHVEIIHTNAGFLGFLTAIGDSDYYPNGGTKQLGCLVDIGGACSHARSFQFFAESINSPKGFYARNCGSWLKYILGMCKVKQPSLMGEHKRIFRAKGTYYLSTGSSDPFAKGL